MEEETFTHLAYLLENGTRTFDSDEICNCSSTNCQSNCTNTSGWNPVDLHPYNALDSRSESLEAFQDQSRFWIQRVLVPLIMTIGVVGNTITIVIMTQRRMRSSTNCYLAALAIFDMSYLVFSFLLSFKHYPNIHAVRYYAYWELWPYLLTLTDASSNSSVWLTVTFTVERYIAVCYPMKGKVICTESRAQKMIILVFVTCFLLTLPTAFEWKILEITDPVSNSTRIQAEYSDLGLNPVYVSVYYWVISVVFVIVPFILLTVFNSFLIRSVHSSKTRRKTMTRRRETGDSARQESKITIMLIAVVILFLVCQLPTAVILLYRSFHHVPEGGNEDLLLRGLGNIFNFLMAINAAGNFVLYCLLSQKYRRTFLQIFCPCLKGKITRLQSVYQNTIYSTVDNESPSVIRKFSVKHSRSLKEAAGRDFAVMLCNVGGKSNRVSFVPNLSQTSSSFTRNDPLFSSKEEIEFPPPPSKVHNGRLLRGFRCPWRREKVSPPANSKIIPFIDLKTSSQADVLLSAAQSDNTQV